MRQVVFVLCLLPMFLVPPSYPQVDAEHGERLHRAMDTVLLCNPSAYAAIAENVRQVNVINTEGMTGTGLSNGDGTIGISEYWFSPLANSFCPAKQWSYCVGKLVLHEARHEWQRTHDGWIGDIEADAQEFADGMLKGCQ